MGLFSNKKVKKQNQLDMFPPLESQSEPVNSLSPQIPDDIPMQLPKFPQAQTDSNQSSPMPTVPPVEPQKQPSSIEDLHEEFHKNVPEFGPVTDINSKMDNDPTNPFQASATPSAPVSEPRVSHESLAIPKNSILIGEEDHAKVRNNLTLDAPIFINVLDFGEILENISEIKVSLAETSNINIRVNNVLKDKDVQFSNYNKLLEQIQKKLIYVDKALFDD